MTVWGRGDKVERLLRGSPSGLEGLRCGLFVLNLNSVSFFVLMIFLLFFVDSFVLFIYESCFSFSVKVFTESLILAQDERWRRA